MVAFAALWIVGMGLVAAAIVMAIPWDEPELERVALLPPPPRAVEVPPERPFPLVLPARAGWDTCMDLSMTTVFRPSWAGERIEPHVCIPVG
jgi:hypothetical protein